MEDEREELVCLALPPLDHAFWQEDDVAETVLETVGELERNLAETETLLADAEVG